MQAEIYDLNNSIKAYAGGVTAIKRANLVDQKRADEAKFAAWVKADPARQQKYGSVLADFDRLYKTYYATSRRDRVLRTIPGVATPTAQAAMPVFKQIVDAAAAIQTHKM